MPSEKQSRKADMNSKDLPIKTTVRTAAFAALIAAGSIFVIPVGPVPITLQTMVLALTGLVLGPRSAVMAVLLYILAGCIGMPVFAGGKAGLGVLFGPTGGYIAGWIPMACLCGIAGMQKKLWAVFALLLLGLAVTHICGIAGLCIALKRTLAQALAIDAVFLPGDLIKAFAAVAVWKLLGRRGGGA